MEKGNRLPLPENRLRRSLRILRPLFWWLILVLVLYGIRTHQRLMEQTRLHFAVTLEGQMPDYDAAATFDAKPAFSGQLISLGSHTFAIRHPKAESFSTNLFTWYGGNNFGTIDLKRAKGTLVIQSSPRAAQITIRGPEYIKTLTNTSGATLVVPTDRYEIESRHAFSGQRDDAVVSANGTSFVRIAPQFGTVTIASSHPNTSFRLAAKRGDVRVNGELPTGFGELPIGEYELTAERRGELQNKTLWIGTGQTNEIFVKYEYGAVTLETDPEGATVLDRDNRPQGITPLTLLELSAGNRQFTLDRDGFESTVALVNIVADQTNHFATNLLSRDYIAALRAGQNYFASGHYDEAAEAASEALKQKPGDPPAATMMRDAMGFSHLARARKNSDQGNFQAGITELKAALESIPENAQAKLLLADYKARQQEVEEKEAGRLAEQRAAEARRTRTTELRSRVNSLSRAFAGADSFVQHELIATNTAKAIGPAIQAAMRDVPPVFEITDYSSVDQDRFELKAGQKVPDGFRHCVVVGGQLSVKETLICFKVIEFQTPHSASLLGGLVQAQVTTESDRNGERAARFQAQVEEGVPMVADRIRRAIGQSESSR